MVAGDGELGAPLFVDEERPFGSGEGGNEGSEEDGTSWKAEGAGDDGSEEDSTWHPEGEEATSDGEEAQTASDGEGNQTTPNGEGEALAPWTGKRVRNRKPEDQLRHQKQKHQLLPPSKGCKEKRCRRRCTDKISDAQRLQLWNSFWSMEGVHNRRTFLLQLIHFPAAAASSQKVYFLRDERGERVSVCLDFFLKTFGYNNYAMIRSLLEKCTREVPNGVPLVAQPVRKNAPFNKKDNSAIIEFVEEYKPVASHYRRENCPLKRFIEDDKLTIRQLFRRFLIRHPGFCSLSHATFKSLNIGIGRPELDQCAECLELRADDLKQHLNRAKAARSLYREEKARALEDRTAGFYAVDLQKVTTLPIMPSMKEVFFSSGILTFNETFAALQPDKTNERKDLCVLWHEGLQKRNAEDIASTFCRVMQEDSDKEHFVFWCDNCTSQNKNWILFCGISQFLASQSRVKTIKIRYLSKGHTANRCDAIHGMIEQQVRKRKVIADFQDYVDVVDSVSENIDVIRMEGKDFRSFAKLKLTRSAPLLHGLVEVEFNSSNPDQMKCRTSFEEDSTALSYLKRGGWHGLAREKATQGN